MNISPDGIILTIAILIFVSIIVSRASSKFGIPSLLLFLLVGMLFGSDGLGVQFYSSSTTQFVGMIALSIILFTGGMDTRISEIKPVLGPGIVLSTLGVLLTAVFTGVFIFWISGFQFTNIHFALPVSLLLASTMSSTDSASVFNLLRSQKIQLKHNLRPLLELESGSNDPMAYMLTIALIQFINSSTLGIGSVIVNFFVQFAVGGLIGYVLGKIAIYLINKVKIPYPSLYPLLLISLIFFTFAATNIAKGNGYLAVYIAGIMVGNNRMKYRKEIANYMDGMTMMFQLIMFLMLGLLVNPLDMIKMIPIAVLISVFMMFIARPASVFISLIPFRTINRRSKLFVSWVGLRGAVPIIFATYPVVANIPNSDQIFNIVFVITLLSLTLQGMTITSFANKLKLADHINDEKSNFGVELPDELNTHLQEIELTNKMLVKGNTLKVMEIPPKTLVMLVKRGDDFLVPNGSLELFEGDKLLIISESEKINLIAD